MHRNKIIAEEDNKRNKGCLINKKGSRKIYILFYYLGQRVEFSTRENDTTHNRSKWGNWLERNMEKIENGTFVYAEAFPGAPEEKKEFFARLENNIYEALPNKVYFKDFVAFYKKKVLPNFKSDGKKSDFERDIDAHLLPFFGNMTFRELNRIAVGQFLGQIKRQSKNGLKANSNKPLSRKRILNILSPLRSIWTNACDKYNWEIRDPFRDLDEFLPPVNTTNSILDHTDVADPRQVWRFDDMMSIIQNIDPFYRDATELMLATGMIASEISGLRKSDITDKCLIIRNFISKGREKSEGKRRARTRLIPITREVKRILDRAMNRSESDYLFLTKRGLNFQEGTYRKNVWTPALKAAGLEYRVPYTLRHTYAAWSLTIGMDEICLVSRMGHASKKMVYEVYGQYVEGLQKDRDKILEYFGRDSLGE